MTFTDLEEKAESFVALHWRTFWGGIAIGLVVGWIVAKIV